MKAEHWRFDADGTADAAGRSFAPASLLVTPVALPGVDWRWELLAIGSPGEIDRHPAAGAVDRENRRRLAGKVIIPGLVNAHAHFDLTHVGPRPYDAGRGFVGWAMGTVRPNRAKTIEAALDSWDRGAALSLAGGVVAVGDIVADVPGASPDARVVIRERAAARFGGMCRAFAEVFGIGRSLERGIESLRTLARAGCPLQPHAPYSAAPGLYREAMACAAAAAEAFVCTHLAETLDERRFVEHGNGAFRELLETIGLWQGAADAGVGRGLHPIEHFSRCASDRDARVRVLAAHVNDCPDTQMGHLLRARVSVAYCPRAHEYFHHPETTGPHRYREMLAAGVNVCLGTDSIINLPREQADRISVLDDMRLLFRRDATDPRVLLAMGTVNGALALGLDPGAFELRPGVVAGLVAVEVGSSPDNPLKRVMKSDGVPVLLRHRSGGGA